MPKADQGPVNGSLKLAIWVTFWSNKKNYRRYCQVQPKNPYILPDYISLTNSLFLPPLSLSSFLSLSSYLSLSPNTTDRVAMNLDHRGPVGFMKD